MTETYFSATAQGWRKHKTHAEETKAVKAALSAVELPIKSVGHGNGTAWAWLEINLGANPGGLTHEKGDPDWLCRGGCPACAANRKLNDEVIRIAQEVTGRHGDHNGEILVLAQ